MYKSLNNYYFIHHKPLITDQPTLVGVHIVFPLPPDGRSAYS